MDFSGSATKVGYIAKGRMIAAVPLQQLVSKRFSLTYDQAMTISACLHGGGGPLVGEVTRLGGATRLSIQSLIFI